MNGLFSEQLSAEIEQLALKSNVDLREYSIQVDRELSDLEEEMIKKYIHVGPEVASLHRQITTCDTILHRMENVLSKFHDDLGTISSEIQDLQSRSLLMNSRLQNRQSVRSELSQFLSDMTVPEHLIRNILNIPVTEQHFLESLHELGHKIQFSLEKSMVDYRSFDDICSILKMLKIKAVTKVREYLLKVIYSLRKPLTNYQISQNQLLKYRFYNEFLLGHDRETAGEIRTEYVKTMSKVYYSYFKAYYNKLAKLQMDSSAEKAVLLGKRLSYDYGAGHSGATGATAAAALVGAAMGLTGSPAGSQTAGTGTGTGRTGLFGLGDRAVRVLGRGNIEAAIIVPHVAAKADVRYPVEALFRSVHYSLLDAACREYYFLADFFLLSPGLGSSGNAESQSPPDGTEQPSPTRSSRAQSGAALAILFGQILGRSMDWLRRQVDSQLIALSSHDAIGLLLCLQLLYAFLRMARQRLVPVLDKFWTDIVELLWVHVTDCLDSHIISLSSHDFDTGGFHTACRSLLPGPPLPGSSGGGAGGGSSAGGRSPKAYALIRPHAVARQYAELAASLHSIGHTSPGTPLLADQDVGKPHLADGDGQLSTATSGTGTNETTVALRTSQSACSPTSSTGETQTPLPQLDVRILSRLSQLQSQFEAVLARLAEAFPCRRLCHVFMINNFDLVVSVLVERGAGDSSEANRCREASVQHTTAYINEALTPYFGSLISFVRDVESRSVSSTAVVASTSSSTDPSSVRSEEARVTRIVKGFNIDWKNSVEKINGEVMMEFANFTLGTQVFQALLAQLVQHYHRFLKVMAQSPYKEMPIRSQLVNIHHILTEVKKCRITF